MSKTLTLVSSDITLSKFFSGKALLKLKCLGLSLNEINEVILQHGHTLKRTNKAQDRLSFKTRLDEHKSLIIKVLLETIETIKHLSSVRSLEDDNSIKAMKLDDLQHEKEFSEFSLDEKILMIYLEELYIQFEVRLRETSAMRTRREEKIAALKDSTKILEKKIDALKSKHELKKAETQAKIGLKEELIQNISHDMSFSKKKCDDEIFDIIHKGNNKIASETRTKLVQVEEIERSCESAEAEFKEVQRMLLADIQKLKEQKLKAEQALQTTLMKFDNDIGSRADELEKVRKEMKSEQKNFEVWQNTIAKQQKIVYEKMMQEKEEEERSEIEEKLKELRKQRLAKLVLKKWRGFVKRNRILKKSMSKKERNRKRR